MRFDIHRKYRFSVAAPQNGYAAAVMQYYRHLRKIDFSKAKQLLKYFGDSFFHDGMTERIMIQHCSVEIDIIRDNDYEDLMDYRKKLNLTMIPRSYYMQHPIIYRCTFLNVLKITGTIDLTNKSVRIMDTEIHKCSATRTFDVLISTAKNKEISIFCNGVKVDIINQQRITDYTNGKKRMPYCEQCNSKLLTKALISKTLKGYNKGMSRK